MPTPDQTTAGAPAWIELSTSDPDAAQSFYRDLFGWDAEVAGPELGNYINFRKDTKRVAGGMRNDGQSGQPDAWSVYLATNDAKATVDAAAQRGAPVLVDPMEVMDLGTMAWVVDPGGAAVGAWQPGTLAGYEVRGEPGTPGWFELHTKDYDAAVAFYRDVFRWDAHMMSDTPEFRYTTLGEGDGQLAGIMDDTVDGVPDVAPHWAIYFQVDDTDAALERVVELGGSVVMPAADTPYGRLAVATDTTGAQFRLMAV